MRVVFAAALVAMPVAASAGEKLPYDIDNFFRTPAYNPQITYEVSDLLFNRVPDHIALSYQMRGLTDYVPQYRDGRDVEPLIYDFDKLLIAENGQPGGVSASAAGSP